MTADELARSYFLRCRKRRVALGALFGVEAYADGVRKERELSFYGEIDFIPEENYSRTDAQTVLAEVDWIIGKLPAG